MGPYSRTPPPPIRLGTTDGYRKAALRLVNWSEDVPHEHSVRALGGEQSADNVRTYKAAMDTIGLVNDLVNQSRNMALWQVLMDEVYPQLRPGETVRVYGYDYDFMSNQFGKVIVDGSDYAEKIREGEEWKAPPLSSVQIRRPPLPQPEICTIHDVQGPTIRAAEPWELRPRSLALRNAPRDALVPDLKCRIDEPQGLPEPGRLPLWNFGPPPGLP